MLLLMSWATTELTGLWLFYVTIRFVDASVRSCAHFEAMVALERKWVVKIREWVT